MGWLESQLENNSTEQEILTFLEDVCTKLPSQYSAQCQALVSAEGPAILNLLAQELPNLCTALHICSSDRREVLGQMMVQLAKDKNMQGGGECSLCKLATSWLGQQLANNATEQEILAGMETLCTKLPSQYSAQCTALVSAEGREVLGQMMVQVAKDKNMQGGGECQLCQLAASWLESQLENNSTEQEILTFLEDVCTKLPS